MISSSIEIAIAGGREGRGYRMASSDARPAGPASEIASHRGPPGPPFHSRWRAALQLPVHPREPSFPASHQSRARRFCPGRKAMARFDEKTMNSRGEKNDD